MGRDALLFAECIVVTHHGFGFFLHRIHAGEERLIAGHLPGFVVVGLALRRQYRLTAGNQNIGDFHRKLDQSPRWMFTPKAIINGLGACDLNALDCHPLRRLHVRHDAVGALFRAFQRQLGEDHAPLAVAVLCQRLLLDRLQHRNRERARRENQD